MKESRSYEFFFYFVNIHYTKMRNIFISDVLNTAIQGIFLIVMPKKFEILNQFCMVMPHDIYKSRSIQIHFVPVTKTQKDSAWVIESPVLPKNLEESTNAVIKISNLTSRKLLRNDAKNMGYDKYIIHIVNTCIIVDRFMYLREPQWKKSFMLS